MVTYSHAYLGIIELIIVTDTSVFVLGKPNYGTCLSTIRKNENHNSGILLTVEEFLRYKWRGSAIRICSNNRATFFFSLTFLVQKCGRLVVIRCGILFSQQPDLSRIARISNHHAAYQATVVVAGFLVAYHRLRWSDQSWQGNSLWYECVTIPLKSPLSQVYYDRCNTQYPTQHLRLHYYETSFIVFYSRLTLRTKEGIITK